MDDIVRIVLLISATFCKLHCISNSIDINSLSDLWFYW